jgi:hypothetical protein
MKNDMEYLEELEEAIRSLRPLLKSDDGKGIYLHEEINVSSTPEQLQKLIKEVTAYSTTPAKK